MQCVGTVRWTGLSIYLIIQKNLDWQIVEGKGGVKGVKKGLQFLYYIK